MNLSVENNEQPLDLGIPCFQTNPVIRYGCYYAQVPTDQTRGSQPASAPNGSAGAAWVLQQERKGSGP